MQIAFASLLWSIEGKARLYCCSIKMLVTCLFFSLNKLNYYFPGLLTHWRWLSRINKIPTYFCQTSRSLRSISISFIGNPLFLITSLKLERGSAQRRTKREDYLHLALQTYCRFTEDPFNIIIPAFRALFAEHATSPFFAVHTFCVALWCLDEHWDHSLFTLFMLIMFERTVVWQRARTLTGFRSMSVGPYPIQCYHGGKWVKVQTDELLPGDIALLGEWLCSPKEFLY